MNKGKLKNIDYCKKKLKKENVEIIRNIELLCFIKLENIKKMQNIIIVYY